MLEQENSEINLKQLATYQTLQAEKRSHWICKIEHKLEKKAAEKKLLELRQAIKRYINKS